MTPTARELVRIVVVGFAVMLALPAAYRIWLAYHPAPERQRKTLCEYLEKSAEANEIRLLMTPLSGWSAEEMKAKPRVCGWLKAHERTVLPWEWTDEARRKDPEGYLKLWRRLFDERKSELESSLKTERKLHERLGDEIEELETVHAQRTNQLAKIEAIAATNSYPMTLAVERLEKGRFWGWNRRTEFKTFETRDAFDAPDGGWTTVERKESAAEIARLAAKSGKRRLSESRLSALEALSARATELLEALSAPPAASSDMLVRELLALMSD